MFGLWGRYHFGVKNRRKVRKFGLLWEGGGDEWYSGFFHLLVSLTFMLSTLQKFSLVT